MIAPVAPLAPAAAVPDERTQLAEAARRFEAIFVRQMLAAARKTELGGDLMANEATRTFRQMQDEHFADLAANSGAFGLARLIETQLAARPPAGDNGNGV